MRRHGMNFRKWIMKRFVIPVLRQLPLDKAHSASERIGHIEFRLLPSYRNHLIAAVRQARLYFDAQWDDRDTARNLAGRLTRWRIRDILLDDDDTKAVLSSFEVRGRENLDEALALNKGVVLVSNHFGGHILPAHWMLRSGIDFRFLTERPRHISQFLNRYFQADGPNPQREIFISRKNSGNEGVTQLFRSIRCLKSRLVLLVACDVRWDDNQSVAASFLGNRWKFTPIWAILAQRSGAPVVPVICSMMDDGRHLLEFFPPEHVAPESDLSVLVQDSLDRIEQRVKCDPCNSNDYFFWGLDESQESLLLRATSPDNQEIQPNQQSSPSLTQPHFNQVSIQTRTVNAS